MSQRSMNTHHIGKEEKEEGRGGPKLGCLQKKVHVPGTRMVKFFCCCQGGGGVRGFRVRGGGGCRMVLLWPGLCKSPLFACSVPAHKGLRCWELDFVLIAVTHIFVHQGYFKVLWTSPKRPPSGKGVCV